MNKNTGGTKMKHVRTLRTIAALLTLVLLLSACGGAAEPIGTSAPQSTTAPAGTEAAGSSEPVKLTYFAYSLGDSVIQSYNENVMYPEMEKILNIDLEFQHASNGSYAEQLSVRVASGDLPDMIESFSYAKGPQAAIDDGVILRLNDLVEQYAPDFLALLESNPDIKREVVLDDGTIWCIPCLQPKPEPAWRGISIRGDLLEQANLEKPETIAEFKAMLQTFKDMGITYPLSLGFGYNNGPFQGDGYFVAAYGIGPSWYKDLENGEVQFGPMQDAYLDFLTEMHSWYAEGLIDPDFATRQGSDMDAYIVNGEVGAFVSGYGPSKNYQTNGQAQNPDLYLVQVANPSLTKGVPAQMRNQDSVNKGNYTVITANCENPEAAMTFLNFGFTEEGAMMYNYGLEGVSYTMVDGKPEFTDAMTDGSEGAWPQIREKYKKNTGPYNRDWEAAPLGDYEYQCMDSWSQAGTDLKLPAHISLTAEESSRFNTIMNDVFTYLNENVPAFINGARSLDEFDTFRADLEGLGINEALEIQRTAYARYKDRA